MQDPWLEYEKIGELGRGATSVVYAVKNRKSGADFAMKKSSALMQEIQILKSLSHPHVVRVHEEFWCGDELFMILEHAKTDLKKIIEKEGPFGEDKAISLLTQLTLGLDYIHGQNVIHRDLKASNVFLGKDGLFKLGDFGSSKRLSPAEQFAETGIGTPYYMAPEVWAGEAYSFPADIWSLGCLLFQVVTGRPPFEGRNLPDLMAAILQRPLQLSSDFPQKLGGLVLRMTEKAPTKRISVSELLADPALQKTVGLPETFSFRRPPRIL